MAESLEHRSHQRLRTYWEGLKGGRPFPREDEIDPDTLRDIWDSCFLISIDDVTHRLGYRYSYLGKDLILAYGDDVKDPNIAMQMLSTVSAPMVQKFDEVREKKTPVVDEAEFVNLKHFNIRYRTCILPLGRDGEITHLIGCMRWKAV